MNSFQFKSSFLKDLEDTISTKNAELLESLKETDKDSILSSTEYIKIAFSENLLEDVNFLNTMSGHKSFKRRYADLITRDLLEQVIEFIYLMKTPEKIPDYIGTNSNIPENLTSNLVEGFRTLGSRRYSSGRMSISEMSKEIDEKKSTEDKFALYDMYTLLSEECHNSYFFSILDDLEIEGEVSALTEYQTTNLTIIIGRFLEAYQK